MELVPFTLVVIGAFISCAAAVVSVIYSRKPASIELQSNVDELVCLVEKMMKEQRKVKMSNVRNSAKNPDDIGPDIAGPQTNLLDAKSQLRAMARRKGIIQ